MVWHGRCLQMSNDPAPSPVWPYRWHLASFFWAAQHRLPFSSSFCKCGVQCQVTQPVFLWSRSARFVVQQRQSHYSDGVSLRLYLFWVVWSFFKSEGTTKSSLIFLFTPLFSISICFRGVAVEINVEMTVEKLFGDFGMFDLTAEIFL